MPGFDRVALINVRLESRQRIPVGLLILAACVRKDCGQVVVFDPDPEQASFADIEAFKPDLVGIGFMTQTRSRAKAIFDALRPRLPGARFILGGVGPTVEKEKTFEMFSPDAVVVGEAELALPRIVRGEPLERVPGVFIPGRADNPPEVCEDLDELPLPAYDVMPGIEKYFCPPGGIRGRWFDTGTPMVITARGCPYRCTFCCSNLMFTRRVRRRSVANVMAEIRRLHNEFGADSVYFFDDTFNVQPSWVEEFCAAISAEPYRLTWGCQVRVNLLTEEQARTMRKAGCVQVDIGVESGSPRVLKAIRKDETVEETARAFDICHRAGIAPMGTFLVGCPGETWEDVELTKSFLRRIRPSFAEFFYLIPYPGSALHEEAARNKWIVDDSFEGRGMVDRPVMRINFSIEEQRRIRRDYFRMMAWRNFSGYLTPGIVLAVLRNLRWSMVRAFIASLAGTGNIRDAMQAYAHALRDHFAEQASRRAAAGAARSGGARAT